MRELVSSEISIEKCLARSFDTKHVRAALEHFRKMVERFQVSSWEDSMGKAGKFVEAVLKALFVHCGKTVPRSREFSVNKLIQELGQLNKSCCDDTVKLLIPRACRFVYDIASNRGGRHDSGEIDPNEMDASVSVSVCSWILAEMVRFSQRGLAPEAAKALVEGLTERKYPLFKEVDGRVYFHGKDASAREIALAVLWRNYPRRINKREVKQAMLRHIVKEHNADVALGRIGRFVDDDGTGNIKLLSSGLREAERIIASRSAMNN